MTHWTERQLTRHLDRTGVPGAANGADVSEPPFAVPDIVIDLPFPPSVNKLWRSTAAASHKVYLAPAYQRWKEQADALLLATQGRSTRKVRGRFTAEIIVCAPTQGHQRGDLDNRCKAVFDFLQRVEVIRDDKDCQKFSVEWGTPETAPAGCRVTVRPCA